MTYCPECLSVEGETTINAEGETVCTECDIAAPVDFMPEHDASDMER